MFVKTRFATSTAELQSSSIDGSSVTKHHRPFIALNDEPVEELKSRKDYAIPWLGLIALILSILTLIASWVILHVINGRTVFTNKLAKPASWLSAILSANSICLHIALSEGHNIAWWYRATRSDVTIQELHELWQYGTSTWSALTAGRSFNYIALATLLVATIPFNGFILQNAISTVSEIQPTPVTLKTSSRESLPLGWSANVNSDGTLGTVPFSIGFFMGDFLAGTGAMSYEFRTSPGCDADATCTGRLAATSFYTTCTPSTIPFDMPADDTTNVTMDATIFSSALSWEKSKPYEMNLRVQWKPLDQDLTGPCKGSYQVRECRMQAATLQQAVVFTTTQPADLSSDVTYLMKLDGFGYQNDTLVNLTPVPSEEGVNNSTYGGFAAIVSEYVSATVNLTYVGGKPALRSSGLYASLVGVGLYGSSVNPDSALSQCNITVGTSSEDDFSTTLVNSIRGLLWYVNARQSLSDAKQNINNNIVFAPAFTGTKLKPTGRYKIIWVYWVGSLAITLCIVIAVTPIYWGFWLLGRKTTMSPFETARAFHAPLVGEAAIETETPILLKEIGDTRVHHDLGFVTSSPRM